MRVETVIDSIRYTLSNESLQIDDEVYPIADGRCLENDDWILHRLNYSKILDEPHIIKNLNHSKYKPYQIQTDKGFGPNEIYYKIIKTEKLIEVNKIKSLWKRKEWVEFNMENDYEKI